MNVSIRIASVLVAAVVSHTAGADPRDETKPAPRSAIERTVLRRVDVPNSNHEVVVVEVTAQANASAGRHTHPGTVVGYVIEGEYTMLIDGRPPQKLKPGDSLEVPAGAIHDERAGDKPAKLLAVFTVEKGKPLATPVSE